MPGGADHGVPVRQQRRVHIGEEDIMRHRIGDKALGFAYEGIGRAARE
jgi:hypothetical protein